LWHPPPSLPTHGKLKWQKFQPSLLPQTMVWMQIDIWCHIQKTSHWNSYFYVIILINLTKQASENKLIHKELSIARLNTTEWVATLGTMQYWCHLFYNEQSSDKIYLLYTYQLVTNCNVNLVNSDRQHNGVHHNLTFHKK
jgi:hypothetical protein